MIELLPRLILSIGLLVIGWGVYRLLTAFLLMKSTRNGAGLESFISGKPGILYFTMEGCLPCKTTQRPVLESLVEELGAKIQVIEVDVVAQPEIADRWGVISVPTTIILDPSGAPRHFNHGVTLAGTLLHQLNQDGYLPAASFSGD
ncbi:MAG: thioredoxin family protein [Anaerolineales bacterium]|nr:thioredoxin family protein [Anaerolineales bacterium]